MFNSFYKIYFSVFFSFIFLSIILNTTFLKISEEESNNSNDYYNNLEILESKDNSKFFWPIPRKP